MSSDVASVSSFEYLSPYTCAFSQISRRAFTSLAVRLIKAAAAFSETRDLERQPGIGMTAETIVKKLDL